MAVGKQRDAWDRTASILSVLINVNRSENKAPVTPNELNPYRDQEVERPKPLPADHVLHTYRRLAFLPVDERKRILAIMEAEKHGKGD